MIDHWTLHMSRGTAILKEHYRLEKEMVKLIKFPPGFMDNLWSIDKRRPREFSDTFSIKLE